MELEEAWAPVVLEEEVKKQGTLLNDSLLVEPDMSGRHKLKIYCKLYYLKHRDLFVTVINDFATVNDVHPIQVVSDSGRIRAFRNEYFGESPTDSSANFAEMDTTEYLAFKSEINIHDHESIRKHGRFLEKMYDADIYYLDSVDAFATVISADHIASLFQNNDLRKKYNIPYQDERLAEIF